MVKMKETRMEDCSKDCYYDFDNHRYICNCGKYRDVPSEDIIKVIDLGKFGKAIIPSPRRLIRRGIRYDY